MDIDAAAAETLALARRHAADWKSSAATEMSLAHLEDMWGRWPWTGSATKRAHWLGWMQASVVAMCAPHVGLEDMKRINLNHAADPVPEDPQAAVDEAALAAFTAQMREKLARSREKGRNGWQDPSLCPEDRLAEMLLGHIPKGNPGNFLDIAILAMMLHIRGADPVILKRHLPDVNPGAA